MMSELRAEIDRLRKKLAEAEKELERLEDELTANCTNPRCEYCSWTNPWADSP